MLGPFVERIAASGADRLVHHRRRRQRGRRRPRPAGRPGRPAGDPDRLRARQPRLLRRDDRRGPRRGWPSVTRARPGPELAAGGRGHPADARGRPARPRRLGRRAGRRLRRVERPAERLPADRRARRPATRAGLAGHARTHWATRPPPSSAGPCPVALETHRAAIFATHVPPFRAASVFRGRVSERRLGPALHLRGRRRGAAGGHGRRGPTAGCSSSAATSTAPGPCRSPRTSSSSPARPSTAAPRSAAS